MFASIALALVLASSFSAAAMGPDGPLRPATVDLSAIRYLSCANDKWRGSGFLIGDGILVTAKHMTKNGTCVDLMTGARLYEYKTDNIHDLTLLTSPKLPKDIPYIKITCQPFKKGQAYFSYGITDYNEKQPIFRENTLVATDYDDIDIDGTSGKHMRVFQGSIAPGMSGGPIIDANGYAHSVNNASDNESAVSFEFADGMLCQ